MNSIAILGFIGGILTTISFIPQLVKAWRTKSTGDISIIMYLVFSTGLILWMIYGVMINSLPILICNAITLAFTIIILIFKIRYK